MALTENGAVSLDTTNDARLNLFFKTVRDIEVPQLEKLIEESWVVDPLDTLKILINWRDCRGGKGDYAKFIDAMAYIASVNPAWIHANISVIPEYGRYLDIVKLWHRVDTDIRDKIMEHIVTVLKRDIENTSGSVSLLAKWIPSERKNRYFVKTLCRKIYGASQSKYLKKLRTEYLTPLRNKINIVETHLCRKDYSSIQYSHVPSLAMKLYKKAFNKHDSDRFTEYLDNVKEGKEKINSNVYPHDLVRHYFENNDICPVVEEQWKVIKKKIDETQAFNNSISICDVSGSMDGTPMEVAIALGILGKNKNRVITFSEEPRIFYIPDGTLYSQVKALRIMPWGYNTNFSKVMELVINIDEPIDKIFVFSDMQFDEAFANNNTHFDVWKTIYKKKERQMPKIIFWNLRGNTSDFPVKSNENGVIMLSGYSPSLLTGIINGKDINPLDVMLNIIRAPRYDLIKSPDA